MCLTSAEQRARALAVGLALAAHTALAAGLLLSQGKPAARMSADLFHLVTLADAAPAAAKTVETLPARGAPATRATAAPIIREVVRLAQPAKLPIPTATAEPVVAEPDAPVAARSEPGATSSAAVVIAGPTSTASATGATGQAAAAVAASPGVGSGQGMQGGATAEDTTPHPLAYASNPTPPYPAAARRRGEQGSVLLEVLVDETGQAIKVAVRRGSGFASLDNAALEAVRQWHFRPARRGGLAHTAPALVPVNFRLTD